MPLTKAQRDAALSYAERRYCSGSDDDVVICEPGGYQRVELAETGVWVLAQLWVPNSEINREDEDDSD